MTGEETKKWFIGKNLWFEYIQINNYSFTPTKEGLKKLSKLLNLKISYISKHITFYLEN